METGEQEQPGTVPRARFMPAPTQFPANTLGAAPPPISQRPFGWEQVLASPAPLARPGARVGILGLCVVGLGMILTLIGLTGLDWLSGSTPFGGTSFSDLHKLTDLMPSGEAGLATVYFGWLAWVLYPVVLLLGIAANIPTPASAALRIVGAAAGVMAAALTFFAIKLASQGPGIGTYLNHTDAGYWLTVIGFLAMGVGAAIRPARL